jgi:hypothetical protein
LVVVSFPGRSGLLLLLTTWVIVIIARGDNVT